MRSLAYQLIISHAAVRRTDRNLRNRIMKRMRKWCALPSKEQVAKQPHKLNGY